MLPHEHFVPRAPAQPGTVRVEHGFGCDGESRSLKITMEDDGTIKARCYRCGEYGRHLSEHARKNRLLQAFSGPDDIFATRTQTQSTPKTLVFPALATGRLQDFSVEALRWLNKYQLTPTEIKNHGILFHPPKNRLILPVWQEGQLISYQTRRLVDDGSPKYLSYSLEEFPYPSKITRKGSREIAVTEDILSGIKCARIMDSAALLGTNISPATLLALLDYDMVHIFMDNDSRQVKLLQGILKNTLSMYGTAARIIKKNRDPKALTTLELMEVLNVQGAA